ncbi:MAG: transporter substrate-binding domain-containing protein [Clostridiaceae bacterium]|nr:transporter substrate-binding domain-containing protein [Clostridiaceae bacterium]
MKKILALTLALMLLVLTLAGCSGTKENKTFRVMDEALDAEQYGIGFRNEDIALGMAVQDALDAMIADGKAAEISKKWFGEDMLFKTSEYCEDTTIADSDDSLQKILDRGTFILGLDDSFPPMGYRDENNNIVGFDIDLATEVCARLGVELVLQPIDWDSKELELSTGKIDCIWNGMTITDERIGSMFIPKPYIANRQVVIVGDTFKGTTLADLTGKVVGLQKGSSSLEALEKNTTVHDSVKTITEYADNVTAFLDLKAGRIDALVVDEVAGRYIMANN